ncbi:MAG: S1-like domain-containing RNA-binding protein [Sporolactobacillus sp.]
MTELQPGTLATLRFSHKAPFGYFLTDGDQEILLHENDTNHAIKEEEEVRVFLYQDHQGRLAATQRIPDIRIGIYNWAPVVSQHKKYGVFVDIGISKDILLSKDDLTDPWQEWPAAGDQVYCSLQLDKKERLFAKLADESIISLITVPASGDCLNKETDARVYRFVPDGFHVLTTEGWRGFLHENETKGQLRLGEQVHVRVIDQKENGTINLSMIPRTYERIDQHAELILQYLDTRDGAMPYWDKSLPEDIKSRFQMSKGDFKKAIGKLMKEKKVYQKDGWTYRKADVSVEKATDSEK